MNGVALLTDGQIRLRALEPQDIDITLEWENDSTLWHLGDTRAPFSRRQIEEYIMTYDGDIFSAGQLRLMIVDNNDRPLGAIDMYNFDPINRRVAIGILVDSRVRRTGIGLRALELCKRYCHSRLGVRQVWALCAVTNRPSVGLFTRSGFVANGVLRSWLRDGDSWTDVELMQYIFE